MSMSMKGTIARYLLLAAALGLGVAQARAQGTPEQREACTPDALRLCSDTVPDVGRTTACMAAHRAELSPRCRAVFDAGAPAARPRTRIARRHTPKAPVAEMAARTPRRHRMRAAMAPLPMARRGRVHVARGGDRDTREARRVIGKLCAQDIIDSGTCGFMAKVLTLAD